MAANVVLNLLLMVPLKQGGLALASSLSSTLNMLALWALLERRVGGIGLRSVSAAAWKIGLLSAAMGIGVFALYTGCNRWVDIAGVAGRLVVVLVPIAGGIILYLAGASAMRLEEAEQFRSLWRRRLKPPSASSSR
jgi:putative peptidoglycan lipid II flippase